MSLTEKRNNKRSPLVEVLPPEPPATISSPDSVEGVSTAECPHCFGTGMEVVPGEGARRCKCQKTDDPDPLGSARIPPRYRESTIQDYDAGNSQSKWHAKAAAETVVDDYLSLDGRGLLFVGDVGVGKTYLAVAVLRHLTERYGVTGLFYHFGELLRQIQDSYNPVSQTSELRILEPVFNSKILVLDELGASKPTDWVRDTMTQIINNRYNEKKLTIFTTNYRDDLQQAQQIKRLEEEYKSASTANSEATIAIEKQLKRLRNRETLEDRIGVRLRSRLYEMCKSVVIEGDDYRKRAFTK